MLNTPDITEAQRNRLKSLTADQVLSVYSGKPGCACGCRGKYSYNSKHVAAASKDRGYTVTPDEVNDRMVTKVLKLVQQHADDSRVWAANDDIFAFDLHDQRTYTVYVKN